MQIQIEGAGSGARYDSVCHGNQTSHDTPTPCCSWSCNTDTSTNKNTNTHANTDDNTYDSIFQEVIRHLMTHLLLQGGSLPLHQEHDISFPCYCYNVIYYCYVTQIWAFSATDQNHPRVDKMSLKYKLIEICNAHCSKCNTPSGAIYPWCYISLVLYKPGAIGHGAVSPLLVLYIYARCLDNSRGNMFQPTCSAPLRKENEECKWK